MPWVGAGPAPLLLPLFPPFGGPCLDLPGLLTVKPALSPSVLGLGTLELTLARPPRAAALPVSGDEAFGTDVAPACPASWSFPAGC